MRILFYIILYPLIYKLLNQVMHKLKILFVLWYSESKSPYIKLFKIRLKMVGQSLSMFFIKKLIAEAKDAKNKSLHLYEKMEDEDPA